MEEKDTGLFVITYGEGVRNVRVTYIHVDVTNQEVNMKYKYVDAYHLPKEEGELFLELVQESLHQGIEGYSDEHVKIIEVYLNDIAYGIQVLKNNPVRRT